MLADQWTVITEDKQPAAHFEHTVAVTSSGIDVLTDGRYQIVHAQHDRQAPQPTS